MVSPAQSEKNPKVSTKTLRQSQSRSYARAIHIVGTKQFCPGHNGTKLFCPRFCPGDKNHTIGFVLGTKITFVLGTEITPFLVASLLPRSATTGQRLLNVAASADHSANATASAGDNDDDNDKANEPLPRAGLHADGGGRQRPNDRLALARRESASSNTDAHGGRTTSSNNVTKGRGGSR